MPEAQAWLRELAYECLDLLRQGSVGRVAVVVDQFPVVLPVNYRLAEMGGRRWVAIRTRPGNVLEQASMHAAFETDSIDPMHRQGWSVLVRGTLHHLGPASANFRQRFDPEPWMAAERDAWLAIEPFSITGRQLHPAERAWPFHPTAYL
jgi:nitroimidazol reductase NimA-like FMN-containing flavoprotein (pyridoxamine 5'-phosphate oxidase superfamily)